MNKLYHVFNAKKITNLRFNNQILELFSELNINKFEANLKRKDFPITLSILENISKRSSIRASNLLEGIANTYDTFSEITFIKDYECKYDNEKEILGYKNAYEYVFSNYKNLSLNEELLKTLHSILFEFVYCDEKGLYRSKNKIVKFQNRNMFSKVLYETQFCDYKLIESSLKDLFEIYKNLFNNKKINNLILIPCFISDFLNISPFFRGNGRISRLLILYLLLKFDYDVVKYVSFDKSIELNQEIYFKGLKKSAIKWDKSLNSYNSFIYAFLYVLNESYKEFLKQISVKESGKFNFKNKVNELIKRNYYPITKNEIAFMLPDVNLKTIESSLYDLLKEKKIKKIGTFKDAKYITNFQNNTKK